MDEVLTSDPDLYTVPKALPNAAETLHMGYSHTHMAGPPCTTSMCPFFDFENVAERHHEPQFHALFSHRKAPT